MIITTKYVLPVIRPRCCASLNRADYDVLRVCMRVLCSSCLCQELVAQFRGLLDADGLFVKEALMTMAKHASKQEGRDGGSSSTNSHLRHRNVTTHRRTVCTMETSFFKLMCGPRTA